MPKRDYYDDPAAPPANSLVVAVTAVVLDDIGRVLLIQRTDNDLWAIPGGARAEADIALHRLLTRYPELTLATPAADLAWQPGISRGLGRLPVHLGPPTAARRRRDQ